MLPPARVDSLVDIHIKIYVDVLISSLDDDLYVCVHVLFELHNQVLNDHNTSIAPALEYALSLADLHI